MKKRLLSILLCLGFLLTLAPVCFSASAATTVSSISLKLTEPQVGQTPATTVSCNSSGYTVHSIDWYDVTDSRFLDAGEKFKVGHQYDAQIWVEAASNYAFACANDSTPTVTASVNGNTGRVTKAYEYKAFAMVVVTCTFNPGQIQSLAINLEGLESNGYILTATEGEYIPFRLMSYSAPVEVYPELNSYRYYPNGFRWSNVTKDTLVYDGDRFKGGCEYYVTVAIKPTNGTFADDMTVTVNGIQATLKAHGSTYAEVGIEVTCFGSIYHYHIMPVVTLPKAGNYVDYGVAYFYPQCENVDYASVLGWYDVATGTRLTSDDQFEAGKDYRVEIQLTASYPYKFAKDANGKMQYPPYITGHEADSYSFGYDSYRGRETITVVKTFSTESAAGNHEHVYTDWQWNSGQHYKNCTVDGCDEIFFVESHKGGTATCTQKPICEVCGYAYSFDEPDHQWSPTYLYRDKAGHAWICATCKQHSEILPHNPGPAATDTEPQTCKDCGYIIEPAKNHTHTLTKVPGIAATCTEPGILEHYTCSGCSVLFSDAAGTKEIAVTRILPLGHTADGWKCDSESHWQTCSVCDTILQDTKAPHDGEPCSVCGYPDETQETDTTDDGKKDNDPKGIDWWVFLLIGLACFGASLTAVVIILKKKKGGK